MKNNFIKVSPYIYSTLAALLLPLLNLGIDNLHYIYLGITTFLLLSQLRKSFSKRNNIYIWFFIFLVFFFTAITPLISSDIKTKTIFESFLMYILPPLFWMLFLTKYPSFNFINFLRFSIYIAFFISILGFIQFFFSRTIFGFIPEIDYFTLDFTIGSRVESGSIFRVRSILPSPQVFALYTSLSFCMATIIFNNKRSHFLIFGIPILLGSLLSGQRVVILVYIVFFVLKIILHSKNIFRSILYFLFGLAILFVALDVVNNMLLNSGMGTTRLLDVFSNLSTVVEYEKEGRWKIWSDLFVTGNPLLGNGIGYTKQIEEGIKKMVTPESYILQLYLEGGFLLLISFLVLFYHSYKLVRNKILDSYNVDIFIALFISLIVVQSFLHPLFFIYWGLLIYPLLYNRSQIKLSST